MGFYIKEGKFPKWFERIIFGLFGDFKYEEMQRMHKTAGNNQGVAEEATQEVYASHDASIIAEGLFQIAQAIREHTAAITKEDIAIADDHEQPALDMAGNPITFR